MLFNSLHFVCFFPLVVILHFLIPHRLRWLFLLIASYYFYMCWEPKYLVLILAATLINYAGALLMARSENSRARTFYLIVCLVGSLGILFSFKYFNFLNDSLSAIFEMVRLSYPVPALRVLLPVGISFYTFQTLSYTIDVYRRIREPERHLGYFALYVSFFPQLVAGPIERSTRLLPQFRERHRLDFERFRSGLLIMGAGFFKKLVVADRLAIYVNEVYANPWEHEGLPVILATYFFAIQIFCDFSGYTDIAIGSARILGYDIMENFRQPYHARSIAEFWRRWHISLSTWFRDYVYIPLGGSRVSTNRWHVNIFIVFLLSGLWHGANWTFVLWGALHGFFLVAGNATRELRERLAQASGLTRVPRIHHFLQILITFHLALLAWVFFRADSVADGLVILGRMFTGGWGLLDGRLLGPMKGPSFITAVAAIIVLEIGLILQQKADLVERVFRLPLPLRWLCYYALAFGTIAFGNFAAQEFIYFQF